MSIEDLLKVIDNFYRLAKDSEQNKVDIPNLERMIDLLEAATDIPTNEDYCDLPPETIKQKMIDNYNGAVNKFTEGLEELKSPPPPKDVNFFIKLLRLITSNDKLLQSKDESRYESHLKLLNKWQNVLPPREKAEDTPAIQEKNEGEGPEDQLSNDDGRPAYH